jgi:hypothetical protein
MGVRRAFVWLDTPNRLLSAIFGGGSISFVSSLVPKSCCICPYVAKTAPFTAFIPGGRALSPRTATAGDPSGFLLYQPTFLGQLEVIRQWRIRTFYVYGYTWRVISRGGSSLRAQVRGNRPRKFGRAYLEHHKIVQRCVFITWSKCQQGILAVFLCTMCARQIYRCYATSQEPEKRPTKTRPPDILRQSIEAFGYEIEVGGPPEWAARSQYQRSICRG